MTSHSQRIFLGGLLVGAVGIASYVLQPGRDVFPGDPPGAEHPGAAVFGALDNRPTITPNSTDATSVSSVAQVLQAVHDSLQRNDLASAKVLLDAVRTYHQDDDQARALQNELQVREGKVAGASVAAIKDPVPKSADETLRARQPAPRVAVKAGRSHATLAVAQTRASAMPGNARPGVVSNERGSAIASNATVDVPRPPRVIAQPEPSAREVVQPVKTEPVPVVSKVQMDPATLPVAAVVQGPKTRAQVRAELEQARADGSLPRFGNPDPAGPGVSTISSLPAK